jgi:hypothetical protein
VLRALRTDALSRSSQTKRHVGGGLPSKASAPLSAQPRDAGAEREMRASTQEQGSWNQGGALIGVAASGRQFPVVWRSW